MDGLSQVDSRGSSIQAFYVYVDWTLDAIPRPYYVGKGKQARTRNRCGRNKRHVNVTAKYGLHRVIHGPFDETSAFETERQLIAYHHTYVHDLCYNGIGCNFTLGGEGSSGCVPSLETRQKISKRNKVSMLGNKNGAGRLRTPSERRHISSKLTGHNVSFETRIKISSKLKGRRLSPEHAQRSALGHRGLGKPIDQLLNSDVIATYRSTVLAQAATGVNRSKICDCCKGRRLKAGGFGWRYAQR